MLRFCLLYICLLTAVLTIAQPISLHPANPHYFEYRNKPVVLITSGEHYGALLNLDFDYNKYLRALAKQELNMTRTFTGAYCEPPGAFNITRNTLAPAPNRFIAPWARSTSAGYRNGGNKFDLEKWDEKYFSRLKDFMRAADKHDIIVEFTLFCPFYEDTMWIYSPMHPDNNINSTPRIARTDLYTLDKSGSLLQIQRSLVEKLVTELNEFDNIIFEICNEPYFGGVTMEWQHAIADLIVKTETNLPKKHLISQNIANGASVIQQPHPAVSVFNYHYAYPPSAVIYNYQLQKPIGDNETGFRGTSDSTYRFEGWRFIIAGGSLYNNLDYSFVAGLEDGTFKYPANQPGGGSELLRNQLMYLRRFINGFDFVAMAPDSTVIDTSAFTGVRFNALSEKGRQYAVYILGKDASTVTLNIPEGRYEVTWMHPSTGKFTRPFSTSSLDGKIILTIPKYRDDIALKILRKKH